jgi:hypothetical protein
MTFVSPGIVYLYCDFLFFFVTPNLFEVLLVIFTFTFSCLLTGLVLEKFSKVMGNYKYIMTLWRFLKGRESLNYDLNSKYWRSILIQYQDKISNSLIFSIILFVIIGFVNTFNILSIIIIELCLIKCFIVLNLGTKLPKNVDIIFHEGWVVKNLILLNDKLDGFIVLMNQNNEIGFIKQDGIIAIEENSIE